MIVQVIVALSYLTFSVLGENLACKRSAWTTSAPETGHGAIWQFNEGNCQISNSDTAKNSGFATLWANKENTYTNFKIEMEVEFNCVNPSSFCMAGLILRGSLGASMDLSYYLRLNKAQRVVQWGNDFHRPYYFHNNVRYLVVVTAVGNKITMKISGGGSNPLEATYTEPAGRRTSGNVGLFVRNTHKPYTITIFKYELTDLAAVPSGEGSAFSKVILRQDIRPSVGGGLFPYSMKSSGDYNLDKPDSKLYSSIGEIGKIKDHFRQNDGSFMFRLTYTYPHNIPDDVLVWKQQSWITTQGATVGFAPLNDFPSKQGYCSPSSCTCFTGLSISNFVQSMMDGNGPGPCWWNAVATFALHAGGIPGFGQKVALSATLEILTGELLTIARQDVRRGQFPQYIRSTGLYNEDNPDSPVYSVMGTVRANLYQYLQFDNRFLFHLTYEYADGSKDLLVWKQSNWPGFYGPVRNFVPLSDNLARSKCTPGCSCFSGLKQDTRAWMTGDNSPACWRQVVGILRNVGGFPALKGRTAVAFTLQIVKGRTIADASAQTSGILDTPDIPHGPQNPLAMPSNIALRSPWVKLVIAMNFVALLYILCSRCSLANPCCRKHYHSVKLIDSEAEDSDHIASDAEDVQAIHIGAD